MAHPSLPEMFATTITSAAAVSRVFRPGDKEPYPALPEAIAQILAEDPQFQKVVRSAAEHASRYLKYGFSVDEIIVGQRVGFPFEQHVSDPYLAVSCWVEGKMLHHHVAEIGFHVLHDKSRFVDLYSQFVSRGCTEYFGDYVYARRRCHDITPEEIFEFLRHTFSDKSRDINQWYIRHVYPSLRRRGWSAEKTKEVIYLLKGPWGESRETARYVIEARQYGLLHEEVKDCLRVSPELFNLAILRLRKSVAPAEDFRSMMEETCYNGERYRPQEEAERRLARYLAATA